MPSWDEIQKAMLQSGDETADDRSAQGISDLGSMAGNAIAQHLAKQNQDYQAAKDALHQGNFALSDWAMNAGIQAAMGTIGSVKAPKVGALAEDAAALPMDEASRMARAKDMGFDTGKTYYHGTPDSNWLAKDGAKFKTNPKGANRFLEGVYLTDNPVDAGNYSGYTQNDATASIVPVVTKGPGFLNIEDPNAMESLYDLLKIKKARPDSYMAKRIEYTPEVGNTELLAKSYAEAKGISLEDAWSELPKELAKRGITGFDIPSYNIRNVFKPNQIRSKFANFDPSKAGSGNISAGVAGAALLGGVAASMQPGEAQAQEFDPLAKVRNALDEARKQKEEKK